MENKRNIDMLYGPLWSDMLRFALPLAATAILQQLFNAADVAVVGRFAGLKAMAAVGSNGPVIGFFVTVFVGVAMGTNVVISTALGRNDMAGAARALHTSVVFSVQAGTLIAVLGLLGAPALLRFLSVPSDVFDEAVLYFRIYIAGMPVVLLYNFTAAVYRSHGDTRTPLLALLISGTMNVALNLFFVVVCGLTVEGVAIATVASCALSAAILLTKLAHAQTGLRLELSQLRLNWHVLGEVLRIGVPSGLQSAMFSISNLCLQNAVNSLGSAVMAGSAAGFTIEVIVFYVFNSFGLACTTFVSHNNGANNRQRCWACFRVALAESLAATALIGGTVFAFARPLLAQFNSDPAVIHYGYIRMACLFASYFFSASADSMSGFFRGMGRSLLPALVSVFVVCGGRIIWVYTVFAHYRTFFSLMACFPVSLFINMAVLAVCLVRFAGQLKEIR